MYRNVFVAILIILCFCHLNYADDISLKELIDGINKQRIKILSGEVYSKTVTLYPATKTEEEITEWVKSEKKKKLMEYKTQPFDPNIDLKQHEQDYLTPYLNSRMDDYREHTRTELTTTIFRVLNPDDDTLPRQKEYKITMVNTPGHPLDRMSELFMPSDDCYLLAFDTRTQVKHDIGDIIHTSSSSSVSFYDSNYYYGYWSFAMFGRVRYRVPSDAKYIGAEKIDGVNCHIITYTDPKGWKVRLWVDPNKDFTVHQFERIHPTKQYISWHSVYKQFKKYGNFWFPEILVGTSYFEDGSLRNRYTVEVIDAEFNVDYPDNFFDIDREFYKPPHFRFDE